jgi:tetratricopeptide (TPR) repeat protein
MELGARRNARAELLNRRLLSRGKNPFAQSGHSHAVVKTRNPIFLRYHGNDGDKGQLIEEKERSEKGAKERAAELISEGVVLCKKGKREEGIASFREALQLDPGNEKIHYDMGIAYFELERYAEAIKCFTKAIEINKEFGDAYFNRAAAYRQIDEFEKAVVDSEKARSLRVS